MRGGGGAFGRPSFGDLRDAEPGERISAGREVTTAVPIPFGVSRRRVGL